MYNTEERLYTNTYDRRT